MDNPTARAWHAAALDTAAALRRTPASYPGRAACLRLAATLLRRLPTARDPIIAPWGCSAPWLPLP